MNLQNFNPIIEREPVDYSRRYHFDPIEEGHCQTTRKGKIVLHRRLVNAVLGINFSTTSLKVAEKIEENGRLFSLIIQPVKEPHSDCITVKRFKFGAVLTINVLFYKLNLNYKRFQYSFISESYTLNDGSIGIRFTLKDINTWPEYLHSRNYQTDSIKNRIAISISI